MDFEKEREAFEAIPRNARVLRGAKFKDGEYVALSLFDESSKELAGQLNYGWEVWQAAKAHEAEKLKGCVVVPKSEITDWYLDEDECIYTDEPDIFLCDLEPGDVLEVKRQQCWQAECQFAAKVYEDEDNINWELFDSKEEAEKAAAHCKAMVEAARGGNE